MIITHNKIFVGWSIGDSRVSRAIQTHSLVDCARNKIKICEKDIASHVFALHKDFVYESHFSAGVVKLPFENWLKLSNKGNPYTLFEFPLVLESLEDFARLKVPYGKLNILQMIVTNKLHELFDMDLSESLDKDNGMICSEYLANCGSNIESITDYFKLPCHLIKPVHYQIYALKEGKELLHYD
jgi:hypothetical protein